MTTIHIPTFETERLTLRAPARSDFAAFAEMLATKPRFFATLRLLCSKTVLPKGPIFRKREA